jgi:hypothetical protein
MIVKPGLRLRSAVCDTEVIVVRAPAAELDLRCGGQPMLPFGAATPDSAATPDGAASIAPGLDQGTLLGKRYGDAELEILITRPGKGSVSVGGELLPVIEPRKLPSSD